MITEQTVKLAAKLYQCRDTAKSLAKLKGIDYNEMLSPYISILTSLMVSQNLEVIPALLEVSKTAAYEGDGMTQLLFMASAVELMEPSKSL